MNHLIVRSSLAIRKPVLSSRRGSTVRPFAALPLDAIRDPRMIGTDVHLLGALLAYARAAATCWPSVATLGQDIRRSRRTVQLSLARLRAAGWVAERPADNATGRVLVLCWREGAQSPPPEWKMQREKECAPPGEGQKPKAPPAPRVMTSAEIQAHYAATGWLDKPDGDPLRRLAERRLSEALRAA